MFVGQSALAYPGHVFISPAPASAPAAPKPPAPSDDKEYSVNESGAASYQVPIVVPPGRLANAPQIALGYSSSNPMRGGIAAGWRMDMPRIEIDTSSGRLGSTYYRSSLSGTRLVNVSEPGVSASGVQNYRAELDGSYTRYERVYGSDGATISWRARTSDGRTWYFGETDVSKDLPNAATTAKEGRWFVTRVVDRFGNSITYNYAKAYSVVRESTLVPVDIYVTSITWGANSNAGLADHARVTFNYAGNETCTGSFVPIGAQFTWRSGFPLMEGFRRLGTIRTEVMRDGAWREARRYQLNYDMTELSCPTNRAHAPLRLLTSVQQTVTNPDGTTVTLPASTFEYGRRDLELTSTVPLTPRGSGWDANAHQKPGGWPTIETMDLDLDGDGRLDRLANNAYGSPTQCMATWQRNLGGGAYQTAAPLTLRTVPWRGNARQDSGEPWEIEGCNLSHQYLRPDNVSPGDGPPGAYNSFRFMDVTGDGRPDLVTAMDLQSTPVPTRERCQVVAEWPADVPRCRCVSRLARIADDLQGRLAGAVGAIHEQRELCRCASARHRGEPDPRGRLSRRIGLSPAGMHLDVSLQRRLLRRVSMARGWYGVPPRRAGSRAG